MTRARVKITVSGSLGVLLIASVAPAQITERISVDSQGAEGNGASAGGAISSDGRFVLVNSGASNLVPGDTNGFGDVFIRDRATGTTERVSVDSSGKEGNGDSGGNGLSSDGRFIVFQSWASDFVAGDTNGAMDVFVHDRTTGLTERVSVSTSGTEGDSLSFSAPISSDGRYVSFWSDASNLVPGDTNGSLDVFVRDRTTGVTERVSVDSSGAEGNSDSYAAAISADGRFVAFSSSASNLVPGDANGSFDIFVHDRTTGTTERVSIDTNGAEGDGSSYWPVLSSDGQQVAFISVSSNLVAGDANGWGDIFVHDRATGITERVSVDSSGAEGNGNCGTTTVSSDARYVAFQSTSSDLVPGDTNNAWDAFVHDRATGITQRVSVDSSGAEGNADAGGAIISSDGRIVGFSSASSNLVPGDSNGTEDGFVHERCLLDASWSNYGAGFPGANGIPSLGPEANPVLGSTLKLDLDDSSNGFTVGLVFVGAQQQQLPSSWGGDLLVVPTLTLLVAVSPWGAVVSGEIPADDSLCGLAIYMQAIEADAGAVKGVSFTPGLELLLGG